jgi:hypothetical protein
VVRDIVVWDLEMIPDLEGYATGNKCVGRSPEEVRATATISCKICIEAFVATSASVEAYVNAEIADCYCW